MEDKKYSCVVQLIETFVPVYVFIGDRGALLDFAMLLRRLGLTPELEYAVLAADTDVDLGEPGESCCRYIVPPWNKQVRTPCSAPQKC